MHGRVTSSQGKRKQTINNPTVKLDACRPNGSTNNKSMDFTLGDRQNLSKLNCNVKTTFSGPFTKELPWIRSLVSQSVALVNFAIKISSAWLVVLAL